MNFSMYKNLKIIIIRSHPRLHKYIKITPPPQPPFSFMPHFSSVWLQKLYMIMGWYTTAMVFVLRSKMYVAQARSSFRVSDIFCDMTNICSVPSGIVAWSAGLAPYKKIYTTRFTNILSTKQGSIALSYRWHCIIMNYYVCGFLGFISQHIALCCTTINNL